MSQIIHSSTQPISRTIPAIKHWQARRLARNTNAKDNASSQTPGTVKASSCIPQENKMNQCQTLATRIMWRGYFEDFHDSTSTSQATQGGLRQISHPTSEAKDRRPGNLGGGAKTTSTMARQRATTYDSSFAPLVNHRKIDKTCKTRSSHTRPRA